MQQKPIHYLLLIVFLAFSSVASTNSADVSERKEHWENVVKLRLENEQTPDQLKAWLEGQDVLFVDYNVQGDLLAVLETMPGDGKEFREHSIIVVIKVVSPEELGPFYVFVSNMRR